MSVRWCGSDILAFAVRVAIVAVVLLAVMPSCRVAAATPSDAADTLMAVDTARRIRMYDQRAKRYRKHWAVLMPTHIKMHFAGNMGLLSVGTGWSYGCKQQWETDIYVGFVPKYGSKRPKATMTLRQNYIPWSLTIKNNCFAIEPLAASIYVNTIFGNEFWVKEPDNYPDGYYSFSTKIRFNFGLGQRLTINIPPRYRIGAKAVTFFYEFSTSDQHISSAFSNSYLKPKDYITLAFGVKWQLL